MIIRNVEIKDIPQIIELGKQMHEESGYRNMSYSEQKVKELVETIISRPDVCLGLVAEKVVKLDSHPAEQSVIIGMAAFQIGDHYFSDDLLARDYLLYIVPGHRGSSIALRFVMAYFKWAEEKGVKFIFAGITTEIEEAEKAAGRLYERMGMRRSGVVYRKDL